MITTLLLLLPLASTAPAALPAGPVSTPLAAQPTESLGLPTLGQTTDSALQEHMSETTVGMRVKLRDVTLPGSVLRAKDVADPGKADAVVRIIEVAPHGTDFRYLIEVMPFVAGVLDLHELLERADGTPLGDLPPMTIQVGEVLPPNRLRPNDIEAKDPGRFGGYWNLVNLAGILWVIGLFFILYLGQRKKRLADAEAAGGGMSLAQRLQPMVESARRGDLSDEGRASLERLLFAYWREKRGLGDERMVDAMQTLRSDEEAGPLLVQLERWLHSPGRDIESVDVQDLLAPYQNVADLEAEALAAQKESRPSLA